MKIVSILIGLLLIATVAFAQPVYLEEVITTITINEDKVISVEEVTRFYKDDVFVFKKITNKQVFTPNFDYDRCTSDKVKSLYDGIEPIANVVWTPTVIAEFEAEEAARALENQ